MQDEYDFSHAERGKFYQPDVGFTPPVSLEPVNLNRACAALDAPWSPVKVAQCNGSDVMVAKGQGSYPWHKHEHTDDFFLVLQGTFVIEMRDRSVTLGAGEMFVVPKGLEHRPVAQEDAYFLLPEPPDTKVSGTTMVG